MDKLKKTFNSTTTTGRANVAKVTYGTFALIFLYYRFFKRSKATPNKKGDENYTSSGYQNDQSDSGEQHRGCGCSKCLNEEASEKNPFPDQPPTACPPSCVPEPPPVFPREEGQCTCRYLTERDASDPNKRNLNPFLNMEEDEEIW